MRRHETPLPISQALASHVPPSARRILDPAVGNGLLLQPFSDTVKSARYDIFAIDTDRTPLESVQEKFGSSFRKLAIIRQDFLRWAYRFQISKSPLFDCIVMNPPFCARKEQWVSFELIKKIGAFKDLPASGPIEAAFVLMAIKLLKKGGRLLAILPASLIATPTFDWLRHLVSASGAIHQVHELPRFTFPGVGSRIYLVVFEKGTVGQRTLLLNHDLFKPEKLLVERKKPCDRLDFGYYQSAIALKALKRRSEFDWRRLKDVAIIRRGSEPTPGVAKSVIHSTDLIDGFWFKVQLTKPTRVTKDSQIRCGDILAKRVSRDCARSFGLAFNIDGCLCSDCVLILRPKEKINSLKILFAVRCLFSLDFAAVLIERGTGASYLNQGDLRLLEIPYGFWKIFHIHFAQYTRAVKARHFLLMKQIENSVKKLVSG